MQIGNRLQFLIERDGLNKKEVAKNLNIAPSTLSGYINNKRQPDCVTLTKMADYFHISVDYLLGHEVNQSAHDSRRLYMAQKNLQEIMMHLNADQLEFLISMAKNISKYDISVK